MTEQFFDYHISEFAGDYPEVPLAIDIEELKKVDPDPFFVTLPIVPMVGAVSKNGLLYDDNLVGMIAEQINSNRPGALFGHIPKDKRDSADPIPAGNWVGAQRIGQQLWAKAYVPNGPARDHMRTLKALGRRIATSIWGEGKFEALKDGTRRAASFTLQNLDFASPERAALGGGYIPIVTAEMEQEQEELDMDKAQVIAELTVTDIPAPLRDAIVAEAGKQNEDAQTITELTEAKAAQDTVIAELRDQLEAQRRREFEAALDAKVAELTAWEVKGDEAKRKLDAFRAMLKGQILSGLGDERNADRVAEIAQAAWGVLEPIAETIRDVLAGPPAIVNGKPRDDKRPELVDTPEARNAAMARMGISV